MVAKNKLEDLGFLGESFQFKFVKEITEGKELIKELYDVIDQNTFTDPTLKTYVGVMKEYYERYGTVPSYDTIQTILFSKARNDTEHEFYAATVDKIKHTSSEGSEFVRETGARFFKQQNIIKTANKILEIAGNGDVSKYDDCVDLLNKALNAGNNNEMGSGVFDNTEETLSNEYRVPMPTGIESLDKILEGGLGKGELGVIIGPSSFGKSQPLDARILTPDGYKLMGSINVGDNVIGRDGLPYKVSNIFPQGLRPIYKVSFSNGTSCECDEEHLWSVSINGDKEYKTIKLSDIKELDIKHNKVLIPNAKAVKFNERELIIHPYALGYIVDGNRKDEHKFKIVEKLIKINTIPIDYLFNTIENRLYLLQGLIDSKGIVNKNGTITFSSKKFELIEQVQFLVRSLGGYASLHKELVFSKKGNEFKKCNVYSLNITMSDKNIPLTDLKNKNKIKYVEKEIRITNIEYVGEKDAQCIMVDSKEHLYITEDFIVTHNTSMTTAIAGFVSTYACEANNNKGFKVLQIVFEDRVKQIQRKHFGRITGVESKDLGKPEYIDKVREQIEHYENKEMMEENLRILRLPSGEKTAWDIERIIKRFINNGFRPDLVIVDYFECLAHKGNSQKTEWEQEGKTMRKFEAMAGDLNIGFWIPLQGTKESVTAELVTMDKAGGSFKKIQIAHIVLSISRTSEDIAENKARIGILKNRAGRAGITLDDIEFNNGTCRITSNGDGTDSVDTIFGFEKKLQSERDQLAANIFKSISKK